MTDPIREALAQALPVMKSYYEALGPCDHDVGICNCDMKRAIENAEAALASPPPEPVAPAIEYLMNEAARGLLKINATPEDVANSLAAIKSLGIAASYSAHTPAAAPADGEHQ